MVDSMIEKRSRYSTLLDVLEDDNKNVDGMSDSNLLKDMCRQIDRALPKTRIDNINIRPAAPQANQ